MKTGFATVLAVILLPVLAISVLAQKSAKGQCSLAVVTRLLGGKEPTCETMVAEEMAQRGNVFEQNQLGIASILAIGPDYSEMDALKWFEQAAQRGYSAAQVNLAVMYINGWGTPVNFGAALRWLHAAADQGHPRAYLNLGILFLNGQGVHQDNAEAFRWFQKGAEADDPDAQVNLGYMYDQGLGCSHNSLTAVWWYRKAADAGNPLAENNLADMYLRGEGVPQDNAEAFRLFQKAAPGSAAARIKLGYMYSQGIAVKKDPETAYTLILSSSLAGDPRGQYLLSSIEAGLSPEQVLAARKRAVSLPFMRGSQRIAKALVQ
jgi:TPR repeat protein